MITPEIFPTSALMLVHYQKKKGKIMITTKIKLSTLAFLVFACGANPER